MDKHFIFKLGPIDRDDGAFYMYYLFPGEDDAWAFPANNDEQALTLITEIYDPDHLICEKELENIAKVYGIETDDYDQVRSHELALMAFEHLPGPPMRRVQQEGLIWQFSQSVQEYRQSRPWEKDFCNFPIKVEFQGNLNLETYGFIHPDNENNPFTLLFEVEDTDQNNLSIDYSAIKKRGHMGVEFFQKPAFALGALQRAHGLDTIPIPYVFKDGERAAVNDLQIGVLTVALTAVAYLKEDSKVANGQLRIGNIDLLANVSPVL